MRYVVLHHTGWGEDHFDFMVEADPEGLLLTWRLDGWPHFLSAIPLPDHRRIYLDYEGAVSGNRGTVRRVEQGTCRIVSSSNRDICVELLPSGRFLRLRLDRQK
ncbi:MAG: hypothetical protein KatS3mg104_0822 [Phycisphaerae bacterium]|jgi:hypothetical protein|nr:MAG: hypothetical protein KatS3mg104_0822 [Phycisphaerae bacterium]